MNKTKGQKMEQIFEVVCGEFDCDPENHCSACGSANDYLGYWD